MPNDLSDILLMRRRRRGVPVWLLRGPDSALPVQQSEWTLGRGWYGGHAHGSVAAYLAAAGGVFARSSTATYFGADAILQTAPSDTLRLDHDPVTGDPLGYRSEGAGTNLLLRSQEFEHVYWNKQRCTVTADAAAAPDGTMTMDAMVETAENGAKALYRSIDKPAVATKYALSVYVRPGLRSWFLLRPNTNGETNAAQCYYHLLGDGALGSSSVIGSGFVFHAGGIQKVAEGLYRAWIVFTSDAGITLGNNIKGANGNGEQVYQGADGEVGSYFWGANLQAGAIPTSHIPTAGSTATRNADDLSYAIAGTATGTVVIRARTPLGLDGDQVLWQWDDGTEDERLRIVRDSAGDLHCIVTVDGTDEVDLDLGAVADDTDLKVAFSWTAGAFWASLNGGAAVSDTSYAGPLPTVDTLREGCSSDGDEWFGTIARAVRYQAAYGAAQLAEMSA